MKATNRILACLAVSLLFTAVACKKQDIVKEGTVTEDTVKEEIEKEEIVFEECNTIFTESYFDELETISVWNGDTEYVVGDEHEKCRIGSLLASLALTEVELPEDSKYFRIGGMHISFALRSGSEERIVLFAGEMHLGSTVYTVDKDVVDAIRTIAIGE